jgi:exodeoxyribonuclease-1
MTFYFYDLETSGLNARAQRIMQFAGQRTDENFKPIGEPQNWLVKLTDEILPDPDAVVLTGITPQKTLEEGYTEAEFIKLFYDQVLQPDTVILGFNTIRFDDEFMRATLWRNFYDPYEWQWQDGRSRWDLIDVVRMVRALRPEGINWPNDKNGQPTNRLELLTKENDLDHSQAHDALSDVYATIAVAKLLKEKQPKIFDYLLSVRGKKQVAALANPEDGQPFLYCSGRYSNKWQKTTAVAPIGLDENGGVLVYDLRQDPEELASLGDAELKIRAFSRDEATEILAVKCMKPNACPAVAPLGVLDEDSQKRLELNLETIEKNYKKLLGISGFVERLQQLYATNQAERKQKYPKESDPDFQIYDGFAGDGDKTKMRAVRASGQDSLADLNLDFSDERLEKLLPRYKARNFPRSLTGSEREAWESYRSKRIIEGANGQLSIQQFAKRLSEIAAAKQSDDQVQYLLQELQLYAESMVPIAE